MRAVIRCAALVTALLCVAAVAHAQATEMDKDFLATVSEADVAEIRMSELALERSSNAEVKAFAGRMLTDHKALEAMMKPFADAWNITPATSLKPEHAAGLERLKGLSGTAFDREYMRAMAADHHSALEIFRSEEASTHASSFKTAVTKGEKVVASHAAWADKLHLRLG